MVRASAYQLKGRGFEPRRFSRSFLSVKIDGKRTRMRNVSHMRTNLDLRYDVIQPAYDVIGRVSHTQVDGRLTCQLGGSGRGVDVSSSKASAAELVLPNCGKRRSERRHRLLPLNFRQWRSTIQMMTSSTRLWDEASGLFYPILHLFTSIYISV